MKWELFLLFIAGLALIGMSSVYAESGENWKLNLTQVGLNMDVPKGYTFYGNFSSDNFEGFIVNPSNKSVMKIQTINADGDMEKAIENVRTEERSLDGYSAVSSENATISEKAAFIDSYNWKNNGTEMSSVRILIPKDETLYSFRYYDKSSESNASYAALNSSISSITLVDKDKGFLDYLDYGPYEYGGYDGIWYNDAGDEYWSWWAEY